MLVQEELDKEEERGCSKESRVDKAQRANIKVGAGGKRHKIRRYYNKVRTRGIHCKGFDQGKHCVISYHK